MHFDKIKQYLQHMRNATYEITIDTDDMIQFFVRTKYTEKMFTVHFRDGMKNDRIDNERPRWHYYYLQFDQENYPQNGNLCSIVEWKWYTDEEDVLSRIKTLKNRYKY